jgi:DNA helicase-4
LADIHLFTIIISGNNRGMVAAFWVIWSLVQVYALPLSVVQFATIVVAYSMANPSKDKED